MVFAQVLRFLLPFALVALSVGAARAEVSRIEIASRTDVAGGKSWGATGAYEELTGTVYFTVDPNNPHNRIIPNIDKAPRDAKGLIEYSADIRIFKPKDPTKGNGVAFFEVPNRGGNQLFSTFARAGKPGEDKEYGDGSLFTNGYTLVWVGWQYSVPHNGKLLGIDMPLAEGVTGKVTSFGIGQPWIVTKAGPTLALDPDLSRYTPTDLNDPDAVLTVATSVYDKPRMIPRSEWQFARLVDGKPVPDAKTLYMKSGFQAGLRYDITYTTHVAPIGGLGYAGERDVASAFKYGSGMPVSVKYTYAFGSSQVGRVLREFIYDGFNADEQGRKAFDAIWAKTGGAARGDFIQPFSLPDGLGIFTGSMFPFANTPEKDPATGKTDSLLARTPPAAMPKTILVNTETEYVGGGRSTALIHTSLDGKTDLKIPDNVRIYMWSSSAHGAGSYPPSKGLAQQLGNANDYNWAMRGVLAGMDAWVRKGVAPPASRYPNLTDGSLVQHADNHFPAIPGVKSPATIPGGYRADLGGPLTAPRLPYLVPKVDADGNDIGGVRMPEISVPLATYTGWNFRSAENGGSTEIVPLTGSFIPFPLTKADRLKTGDPRLSIEERYKNRADYLARIRAAAEKLVQERYVLAADVDPIVEHAGMVWDGVTGQKN